MNHLLNITFGFSGFYIYYYFYETFLEQKREWKQAGVLLLLAALGTADIYLLSLLQPLASFSMASWYGHIWAKLVITGFLAMLPLRGSMKTKLLLGTVVFVITLASDFMAIHLYTLLVHLPLDAVMLNPIMEYQIIAFCTMMLFPVMTIICYIKKRNNPVRKNKHMYLLEIVLPLISVAIFSYLAVTGQELDDVANWYFTDIMIFVLLINTMAILGYSRYSQQTLEYGLQEQQYRLTTQFREQHYKELEAHQAEIRSMKHDLKNQLIAMSAYVQTGSAKRAGEQLDMLISQITDSGKYAFTPHAGINGLLAQKHRQAEKDGILCEFRISLQQETGIADTDLAALVGNILDNALEACRYCDGQRYIRLEIVDQNGLFILQSENSTDGRAQTTRTRKKDVSRHGLGMGNIRHIVEKYNGQMQYRFMPFHFELELTLFHQA